MNYNLNVAATTEPQAAKESITQTVFGKMPIVDLHLHTDLSDGALSVEQVVDYVAEHSSIKVAAIADHDTVAGIARAKAAFARKGIVCISAIEMTSRAQCFGEGFPNQPLHVLGYGFNERDGALCGRLARRDAEKRQAIENWLNGLRRYGIDVDYDCIETAKGTYVLPDDMRRAVLKAHPERSADEAVKRELARAEAVLDAVNPTVDEVIALIKSSGGVAVWAHPYQYYVQAHPAFFTVGQVAAIADILTEKGLCGLECFYERFSVAEQAALYEIARSKGLICTAGSDFHNLEKRNRLVSVSYPEMQNSLDLLLSLCGVDASGA